MKSCLKRSCAPDTGTELHRKGIPDDAEDCAILVPLRFLGVLCGKKPFAAPPTSVHQCESVSAIPIRALARNLRLRVGSGEAASAKLLVGMFTQFMVGKASFPAPIAGKQGNLSHRQNACVTRSNTVQTFFEPAYRKHTRSRPRSLAAYIALSARSTRSAGVRSVAASKPAPPMEALRKIPESFSLFEQGNDVSPL